MDGFNTITGASPIADSMVTESNPIVDTSQHIVGARGNILLRCLKNAIRQTVRISEMATRNEEATFEVVEHCQSWNSLALGVLAVEGWNAIEYREIRRTDLLGGRCNDTRGCRPLFSCHQVQ